MTFQLPAVQLTRNPQTPVMGRWTASIPGICDGCGSSPEVAVADLLSTISALWAEIACESDADLAPDSIALKRQLLALIDTEATR
jgi:hypothetical protein